MNRDQWHAYIESTPLTENQLGRIMREFHRLGLDGNDQRTQRLAVTAALAGLAELASTSHLTEGQAGRVVRALIEARDPDELPAISEAGDDDQDDSGGHAVSEPAAPRLPLSRALLLVVYALTHPAEADRVLQLAERMAESGRQE